MGWLTNLTRGLTRLMSSNQHFLWIYWCRRIAALAFKFFMKVLGPIMLMFALTLFSLIVFFFLVYIYPDVSGGNFYLFAAHFIFGVYMLVNVIFNYIACAFTNPGSPSVCHEPSKVLGEIVSMVDGRQVTHIRSKLAIAPAVSYRYCRHCKCIKPPRAHHDR